MTDATHPNKAAFPPGVGGSLGFTDVPQCSTQRHYSPVSRAVQ